MQREKTEKLYESIINFINWVEKYGFASQDQYDYWASKIGQRAKSLYYRNNSIGTIAVAPFVFMETFFPSTRQWFSPPSRFPIADAHYSMGFSYLFRALGENKYKEMAEKICEELIKSRCKDYQYFCWGYPFDWAGNSGALKTGTPLITTTPYVYEAFYELYSITKDDKILEILHSIAEHAINDIKDTKISSNVYVCSYTPFDNRRVVNANCYRAYLLTHAAKLFNSTKYGKVAGKNINFIIQSQNKDGSWLYAKDGKDKFVDNFHTCFVLKNLEKINNLINDAKIGNAIDRGVNFFLKYLIDDNMLPIPFAKKQRLILYKRDIYDYAENINLGLLLRDRYPEFNTIIDSQFLDLISRWQRTNGSFRSKQLLFGWNSVPYHRWAQSQLFRSLSLWYLSDKKKSDDINYEGIQ